MAAPHGWITEEEIALAQTDDGAHCNGCDGYGCAGIGRVWIRGA